MKNLFQKAYISLGLITFCLPAILAAPAPLTTFSLKDGDCLVFCGDSITHQCLYTQYVEDFFFTRFPDRRLELVNAGVSGDKAGDALVRFSEDVAVHQPDVVTVLLGMNDGQYRHFDHEIFARYEQDMSYLMDRITELGATAILMGPSMYDSRVSQNRPPSWIAKNPDQVRDVTRYYSGVLAFYGAWVRDRASDRGMGYVELLSVMNDLTERKRAEDPEFTMIPDAVHPNAVGHAVMAAALIEQMNLGTEVSSVRLSLAPDGAWKSSVSNSMIENLEGSPERVSFRHRSNSLPWVLPEEAREGLRLYGASSRLNRELLQVAGLQPGRYQLAIDDVPIAVYGYDELAAGIELQDQGGTPQCQQAMEIAAINKERNDKVIHPLRNLWLSLRTQRNHPETPEGLKAYEEWKATFDQQTAELEKRSKEYVDRIYELNQPRWHSYSIVRSD